MMPRPQHLPAPSVLLLACVFGASVLSANEAPPAVATDADTKLRSMSDYQAGLSAVSVEIDTDQEVIDLSGQKLQYSASMHLLLQRPDRLRVERHGAVAESELLFDGTKVQLAVVEPPMVAEVPVQGEIEAAIRALR